MQNRTRDYVESQPLMSQDRRKPERHFDDGGEIDWTLVWIALIAGAVVVAVFYPWLPAIAATFAGEWSA